MRIFEKKKFYILLFLILSFGIIYAPNTFALSNTGGSGNSGRPGSGQVVEESANLGWDIGSVAYCWSNSDGWKYPATADEKKKLDAPVGAFAHLTFDNSGSFNAQASSSENVTEHGG